MMNEVLKAAYTCLQKNDPCVLVTAVRTKGSTPQKPGAKLLVRADGTATGTLGGGCMEGDLWYAAQQLLKDKGEPQFRQYTLNEEMAARDGLVCGGTMYFFLEPFFDSSFWQPLFKDILTGIETGPPLVVATIVQAPQHPDWVGKKILLHSDDSQSGDILNEEMEREIRSRGKKLAPVGGNQSFELSDGTEIFIEGFTAPSTLILMGGGHVNRMVVRLADLLGFRIIVIDDRSEFANKERFPEAECVIVADYSEGLKELSVRENSYIVIATRGHRFDDLALASALRTPARYIGLLGSRRKSILIFKNLIEQGFSREQIERVHAPIGLNIGALTPEELAVSIMGEIIKQRRGGDGTSLTMDKGQLETALQKEKAV